MEDRVLVEKAILDRFRLDAKVAVVTGARRGIGRAFAHALGEAGAAVAVVDINGDAAASVVACCLPAPVAKLRTDWLALSLPAEMH